MRSPRQEYWSGLPFPAPGDLLNPGMEPGSPTLAGGSFTASATWEASFSLCYQKILHNFSSTRFSMGGKGEIVSHTEFSFFVQSYTFCCLVSKSCLILCYPVDFSLPGSSSHGISQARMLKWAAIFFSRGSSQSRDQIWVSFIAGRFFTAKPPQKPYSVLIAQ